MKNEMRTFLAALLLQGLGTGFGWSQTASNSLDGSPVLAAAQKLDSAEVQRFAPDSSNLGFDSEFEAQAAMRATARNIESAGYTAVFMRSYEWSGKYHFVVNYIAPAQSCP